MSTWDSMTDSERADMRGAGRDEGGRHVGPRPVPTSRLLYCATCSEGPDRQVAHLPGQHVTQGLICEECGSPDVREVEVQRVTGMGPSVWRCVECGHEQTNETEHEALRRGQRP